MFSRSSTSSSDLAKQRELEKKLIEQAQAECRRLVDSMHDLSPAAAERTRQRLDAYLKEHPKIPLDFKRKVTTQARAHECAASMRAADAVLKQALAKARHDDRKELNRLVGEARNHAAKAASFGADDDFQIAVRRKVEIIMLTGGVEHDGPTAAKPLSTAPANPHHAKD